MAKSKKSMKIVKKNTYYKKRRVHKKNHSNKIIYRKNRVHKKKHMTKKYAGVTPPCSPESMKKCQDCAASTAIAAVIAALNRPGPRTTRDVGPNPELYLREHSVEPMAPVIQSMSDRPSAINPDFIAGHSPSYFNAPCTPGVRRR